MEIYQNFECNKITYLPEHDGADNNFQIVTRYLSVLWINGISSDTDLMYQFCLSNIHIQPYNESFKIRYTENKSTNMRLRLLGYSILKQYMARFST